MEWSNQSKYNSFNSYKGLTFFEHYKKIVGWFDGKNELPPPIEASLDPINACNSRCPWCNSQRYLREHPAGLKRWGRDYMEDLLCHLVQWGVKAFCWGGGGESTLNPRLAEMTRAGVLLGMECSIITNGIYMPDNLMDALLLCRWIGISLDSADPEVYRRIKGINDCGEVLTHIRQLVRKRTNTDIAVKVLILPETIDTIFYTCQVARELGVQDFHVRPVDLERKDFKVGLALNLDIPKIQNIFEECHKLETKDFHVYTVQHKFNDVMHNKENNFRCLASPLLAQVCTDKALYACVDHRLEERFRIGSFADWGSDKHRELLKSINPAEECARCTFREYNIQCEEVVLNDRMCRNFP